jgi:hypothetical protein
VPISEVVTFLNAFVTHEAAIKVNSRVLADYIAQQDAGELASWTVVLLNGDGEDVQFGDHTIKSLRRAANERCYKLEAQKQLRRFIIRRLLAPRDEAIDLNEEAYAAALHATVREWQEDPGRSRRQTAPEIPSGTSIRASRGRLTPKRGLLLLYPLDPGPAEVEFNGPIMGFGISFPASENARKVSYAVINVYWSENYGEDI